MSLLLVEANVIIPLGISFSHQASGFGIEVILMNFFVVLRLIQIQMTQKPMLREEVGMRTRCANKASAE